MTAPSCDKRVRAVMVGQPNVGKSALFTRLTGVGVISSNYPGTTVTFDEGTTVRNECILNVRDLPGTYGITGSSDDERAVLETLRTEEFDCVILVANASSIDGSLVLCSEILELGLPTIVALNKMDEARKRYIIDIEKLSKILGVPVIPVSAKTVEGVDGLADAICRGEATCPDFKITYDSSIETAISSLEGIIPDNLRFSKRGVAVNILENSPEFDEMVDEESRRDAEIIRKVYAEGEGRSMDVAIAEERFRFIDKVLAECKQKSDVKPDLADRISDITITPRTGIPILALVCLGILATIIYAGSFLDAIVSDAYTALVGDRLAEFGYSIGGELGEAILQGISDSIQAIIALVIPYIVVFYIILGILEDSGYLTRAVVLLDRTMHHFGLHGGAFIPMIVGIGCNVPAMMAVRTVKSRREKVILASIIVMAVPCSAQMAIIMGVTGKYAGFGYSVGILLMLVCIGALAGVLLNKFMKYEPSNLAMELPPLRIPTLKNVLFKTWDRTKDFVYVALPLMVVGSVVLQILTQYDLLNGIVEPLSPIISGWLGLPAVCAIAFVMGILRKEMAAAMLVSLAYPLTLTEFMTPDQFVVFGVVMAIYLPCIATLITMWREIGWKETIEVSFLSIGVAILVGGLVHFALVLF